MDITIERDGTSIGSLFQQIIADMKVSEYHFSFSFFFFLISVIS